MTILASPTSVVPLLPQPCPPWCAGHISDPDGSGGQVHLSSHTRIGERVTAAAGVVDGGDNWVTVSIGGTEVELTPAQAFELASVLAQLAGGAR